MHKIFFAVNTDQDFYLPSQLRNHLNKNNINHVLFLQEFQSRGRNDSDRHKKYHERYETWYDFNLIDYVNVLRVIRNYNQNLGLLTDLEITTGKHNDLLYLINHFKNLEQCDLYCFSIYQQYFLDYIISALTIFRKNPKSRILFGGPEMKLMPPIRELCNRIGISTSIGDLEPSVQRALTEPFQLDYTSYLKLNTLTEQDVPLPYSKETLEYANYRITINSSRGCPNNCYYCSGPQLSNYRSVKRDIFIDWIKQLQNTGIKNIFINDNNFGANRLEYVVDQLAKFNKIPIGFELELRHLTPTLVEKMKEAKMRSQSYGLECIHPEMSKMMNKKMPDIDKTIEILSTIKSGKWMNFFYIYGLPGQNKRIFKEEIDYIKKIQEKIPYMKVEPIPFYLSPKSYIEQNRDKFKIKIVSTLEEDANKILPEHSDLFKRIYNRYDYPERKNINDYYNLLKKEGFKGKDP